jgi:hypothetical protein
MAALASLGFALLATGADSVLGGLAKALVLALACAGVAAASGGIAVARNGIPARAWQLHGLALLLAAVSYVVALGVAESA